MPKSRFVDFRLPFPCHCFSWLQLYRTHFEKSIQLKCRNLRLDKLYGKVVLNGFDVNFYFFEPVSIDCVQFVLKYTFSGHKQRLLFDGVFFFQIETCPAFELIDDGCNSVRGKLKKNVLRSFDCECFPINQQVVNWWL